jgi:hypothetical protein
LIFNDEILDWAINHKNASLFMDDLMVKVYYTEGEFVGENFEPLL